jgi:uncharacterized membrane protein
MDVSALSYAASIPADNPYLLNRQLLLRPVQTVGLLLGIGLGAFVDGIVFHQLLQWHNMMSSRIPPTSIDAKRQNMFWDDLFHLFAWLVLVIGIALFWRVAGRRDLLSSTAAYIGLLILGLGLLNLVEGTVNHLILGIHHVREVPNPVGWDLRFLVVTGLFPILLGWLPARDQARWSVAADRR